MTEAEALQLIARTFPPLWTDLWAGRDTPSAFGLASFTKPHTYFRDPKQLEDMAPGLTGVCPLMERYGEAIVGWLPDSDRFVQAYYEDLRDGDEAIDVLGRGYQQFLLALCLELEDAGLRDEWLEFADAARFDHAAELTAVLDREPFDEGAIAALHDRIGPK